MSPGRLGPWRIPLGWFTRRLRPGLRAMLETRRIPLLVNREKVPVDGALSTLERHLGPDLPGPAEG